MGRPSDKRHSARRSGKRERARVKKKRRGRLWCSAWGADASLASLGWKKRKAAGRSATAFWRRLHADHLAVK